MALTAAALQEVWHRYHPDGRWILRSVDLALERERIHALLGRNGAGKSTLVEILAGLQKPSSGTVRQAGGLGYVAQDRVLDAELRVREVLRLVQRARAVSDGEMADAILGFGLESCLDAFVGALSGGMQRRLDVALGFVGQPDIIVLDEPTVGMDPQSRTAFWRWIRRKSRKAAILYTTQELAEAEEVADRLLLLTDGTLEDLGESEIANCWRVTMRVNGSKRDEECDSYAEASALADKLMTRPDADLLALRRPSLEDRFRERTQDPFGGERAATRGRSGSRIGRK